MTLESNQQSGSKMGVHRLGGCCREKEHCFSISCMIRQQIGGNFSPSNPSFQITYLILIAKEGSTLIQPLFCKINSKLLFCRYSNILNKLHLNQTLFTYVFHKFITTLIMQDSLQMSTVPYSLPHQDDLDKFLNILGKQPESRTHKQSSKLVEYGLAYKSLNQLADKLSPKFVKTILTKYTSAICVGPNCLIAQAGQKIINFYIVITGRVVAQKQKNKKSDENGYNKYQRLGALAHSQMKQNNRLKRKRIHRLSVDLDSQHRFSALRKQCRQDDLEEIQFIGIQERSLGTKYNNDIFTTQKAILLEIPVSGFLTALAQYLDNKINELYGLISHYPCFHGFEKELIEKFIISLSEKKQKRGSIIYRQHEHVRCIYLLASGQVKLTKESNLFVENPNNLYANRISLMVQSKEEKSKARYQIKQQEMKKAEATLPYADLSLMFNYIPKKKTVQISRLHSFCIFGGEELIENKNRETNAICNSLQVNYFQIPVIKIKEIFGKHTPTFIKGLKAEAKDKVLHRQHNYANTINFENKANLNYFYYEGDKEKKSPHKHKILKLNNKIEQKSIKTQSLDQKIAIAPHYTAFNFHKLTSLTPIKTQANSKKKLGTHESFNPETKNQTNESDDQIADLPMPNKQQMKIMNISHTWKLIQQKVDVELIKSQKLSPQKFTIDVNEPLIDNKFFTHLDREKRRVQRQIRKDKITLIQNRSPSQLSKPAANV